MIPFLVPLEGGFVSPGVHSFDTPPLINGVPWLAWFTKPMLQALVAVLIIIVFWLIMSRKNKMVPTKGQFMGEFAYDFIRNGIARDTIGSHDFRPYVPFLVTLFSFLLINNLWGIFPLTLMPTASHVGWAYGLTLLVWLLYIGVGIRKHGPIGYLKHTVLPKGVPVWMWPLIIPIEFLSNILVRPTTLSLRLFANMFAGHLLVIVFVAGGDYLLLHTDSIVNNVAGVASLLFSMAIFVLETFVQCLQAFIFTILTAVYISSSLADEH